MREEILVISHVATNPSNAGNSSCINSYCKILKDLGCDVHYLWIRSYNSSEEELSLMKEQWGDRLFTYKYSSLEKVREFLSLRVSFLISKEHPLDCKCSKGLHEYVSLLIKNKNFDSVLINYVFYSKLFDATPSANKILFTHDVFADRYKKTGHKWFSISKQDEKKALDRADVILAIQDEEGEYYQSVTQKKVLIAYSYFNIVYTELVGNKNLLYLGSDNVFNVESLNNFISGPFQEIIKKDPEVKLVIGGKVCERIDVSNMQNLELCGRIDNIETFYNRGNIAINPTENGTGLKIKSFEALAYGKVLVAHEHSVAGIDLEGNKSIFKIAKIDEFSDVILNLLNSEVRLQELKKDAYSYIEKLNRRVYDAYRETVS